MLFLWVLIVVVIIGSVSISNEVSIREGNMFITFIWSCTNFLIPKTNG